MKTRTPFVMTRLGAFLLGWADDPHETDWELIRLTREIEGLRLLVALCIFFGVFFTVLAVG